jgi:glycosyltransferase involved in cell wall biosynthesis
MPIYFLCPDDEEPYGGIRTIYRHAALLCRHGLEACIVHERRGFRYRWSRDEPPLLGWSSKRYRRKSSALPARLARRLERRFRPQPEDRPFAQLKGPPSFAISEADVVVIPELYGPHIAEIAPGVPKVVFNQGVYLTFYHYPQDLRGFAFPYRHPEVVATIVPSLDSVRFMEYVFPCAHVFRVRNSIDTDLFRFEEHKAPQVAYMPRRNRDDALRVLAILAARGALDGVEVVAIEGLSEQEVAAVLRRSAVFLNLGYQEGFGLPGIEAMACGAIVIGYDGGGGREYLLPELSYPVRSADVVAVAASVEQVLAEFGERPESLRELGRRASDFVSSEYSPAVEEKELLAAWSTILGR